MIIWDAFEIKRGRQFTVVCVKLTEESLSVGDYIELPLIDGSHIKKKIEYIDIGFVRGGIQPNTIYKGDNASLFFTEISSEEIYIEK